jgi:hypothetical protein
VCDTVWLHPSLLYIQAFGWVFQGRPSLHRCCRPSQSLQILRCPFVPGNVPEPRQALDPHLLPAPQSCGAGAALISHLISAPCRQQHVHGSPGSAGGPRRHRHSGHAPPRTRSPRRSCSCSLTRMSVGACQHRSPPLQRGNNSNRRPFLSGCAIYAPRFGSAARRCRAYRHG